MILSYSAMWDWLTQLIEILFASQFCEMIAAIICMYVVFIWESCSLRVSSSWWESDWCWFPHCRGSCFKDVEQATKVPAPFQLSLIFFLLIGNDQYLSLLQNSIDIYLLLVQFPFIINIYYLCSASTLLLPLVHLQTLRPLLLKQVSLKAKIMIAPQIIVDLSTGKT